MNVSLPIIWLIITVVMSVIELMTMGLVTIWFAAGAVIALLLSLIGAPLWLQVAAFLVVSVVVLVLVRPIAAAHFNNRLKKTNIDAIIGRNSLPRPTLTIFMAQVK